MFGLSIKIKKEKNVIFSLLMLLFNFLLSLRQPTFFQNFLKVLLEMHFAVFQDINVFHLKNSVEARIAKNINAGTWWISENFPIESIIPDDHRNILSPFFQLILDVFHHQVFPTIGQTKSNTYPLNLVL